MIIDRDIIKKSSKGDRKSQFILYKMIYENFMAMCVRYRKDKTKATVSLNGGFVKIIDNLDKVNNLDGFEAWVRRILLNHMFTEINKEKKYDERNTTLEKNDVRVSAYAKNQGSQRLDAEYLKHLLANLPSTTGKVFNLFAIDGYSHKEISELMNISTGTSKWHVSEARKKLRSQLAMQQTNKVTYG